MKTKLVGANQIKNRRGPVGLEFELMWPSENGGQGCPRKEGYAGEEKGKEEEGGEGERERENLRPWSLFF